MHVLHRLSWSLSMVGAWMKVNDFANSLEYFEAGKSSQQRSEIDELLYERSPESCGTPVFP